MGQVQLHDMSTESSNLSLVSCSADPTAVENQNTGQVQAVWREGRTRNVRQHVVLMH